MRASLMWGFRGEGGNGGDTTVYILWCAVSFFSSRACLHVPQYVRKFKFDFRFSGRADGGVAATALLRPPPTLRISHNEMLINYITRAFIELLWLLVPVIGLAAIAHTHKHARTRHILRSKWLLTINVPSRVCVCVSLSVAI